MGNRQALHVAVQSQKLVLPGARFACFAVALGYMQTHLCY
uniref:Uncharacterized protein n=1 Tax=Anguilla anguilla TaxID=7936 RepID=A0A0E9VXI3_ANGAN